MPVRASLALLVGLGLLGCGSTTSSTGQPGAPTPEPGPTTPGVPAPAEGVVTYLPVRDAAYQMVRHDSITLQLPGGASQVQLIDRTAYVHVSLAREANGYLATIVLDSLQAAVGGVPAVPDSVIPARGTHWTATLSADGELSALKADRSTTLGDQIGSNLRLLFPALPSGGARVGMEWTDTTEVPLRTDAFDAVEKSVTTFRASDSDDPRIQKALKLDSKGSYQRSGKGAQYDQQMEMTASGNRSVVYYLNADGTVASARGSDSGNMTITVPAVGQTVPVKQAGNYSISSLRQPRR